MRALAQPGKPLPNFELFSTNRASKPITSFFHHTSFLPYPLISTSAALMTRALLENIHFQAHENLRKLKTILHAPLENSNKRNSVPSSRHPELAPVHQLPMPSKEKLRLDPFPRFNGSLARLTTQMEIYFF
jgi:hypothetical protein